MTENELPQYVGKYFATLGVEPVILTIEETHMTVAYSSGEIDPFYTSDARDLVSWVAVEKAFRSAPSTRPSIAT